MMNHYYFIPLLLSVWYSTVVLLSFLSFSTVFTRITVLLRYKVYFTAVIYVFSRQLHPSHVFASSLTLSNKHNFKHLTLSFRLLSQVQTIQNIKRLFTKSLQ